MQTIVALLKITGSAGSWATQFGKRASAPEIMVGVSPQLKLIKTAVLPSMVFTGN